MNGLLALVGGQEHRQGCEAIDRILVAEAGVRRPNVVVLLAASTPDRWDFKRSEALHYWEQFDARVTFGMDGGPGEEERALEALREPDLVVLTGGRPWLLQQRIQGPVLDRLFELWESGVPLAGSSAGAMALCGWHYRVQPRTFPTLVRGWGPVQQVAVLPHFERHGLRYLVRLWSAAQPHVQVLGLSDRTALVGRTEDFQVVGRGGCTVVSPYSRFMTYRDGAVLHLGSLVNQLRAHRLGSDLT